MSKRRCLTLLVLLLAGLLVACTRSATTPISVTPSAWSDSFDGVDLDHGWRWMREEPRYWELDVEAGALRIATHYRTLRGTFPNNQSNILLRQPPHGDFTIQAQLELAPSDDFQQAGLLAYRNDDHYLLLARGYCSTCLPGGQGVFLESERSGVHEVLAAQAVDAVEVELRLVKSGQAYTAHFRTLDGRWEQVGQVERPDLAASYIGLSASVGTYNPAVDGLWAAFRSFGIEAPGPYPLPTVAQTMHPGPVPVIVDDDGSPDGTLALLYFLQHPDYEVKAITVTPGEATPVLFAGNLLRMLARLGISGIPVAAGRDAPLQGDNAFPDPWRASTDVFWNIELPEALECIHPDPAAQLIVDVVRQSAQPVLMFVSGLHTNLAEALRLDPGIAGNIRWVQVMGGAAYVAGNINSDWPQIGNKVAEWNIWVDPVAADEVFRSGVPLRVVPLDLTNQVRLRPEERDVWAAAGTEVGTMAAELLGVFLRWSPSGAYVWDTVTAVQATDPQLFWTDELYLEVTTAEGDQQGRTVPHTDRPPNASVALIPDPEGIRSRLTDVLSGGR
jgi:purine nucleosidase/pyrimidine-specific ribonucleoside hydrolase